MTVRSSRVAFFVLVLAVVAPLAAGAQEGDSTAAVYRTPPDVLVDMVTASPTPTVLPSPDRAWLLVLERPSYQGIEDLAGPELRLAGMRIDPAKRGRSRRSYIDGLALVRVGDGEERPVTGLPADPKLGDVAFSPDGRHAAFTHTGEAGVELWVLEVATGRARRLAERPLNQTGGWEPAWLATSDALIVPLVPAGQGAEPTAGTVPAGPVIQQNQGRVAPARTYQDLLANGHDEALFAYYLSAQLARVGLDGTVTELGGPLLLDAFDPSPDGRFLLVESLHQPFSYRVPAFRFPRKVEVWDAAGQRVREIVDLPLHDEVPMAFGSVPTGPREHAWREDAPATLTWAEALDGGDAGATAEERDRLFLLPAPFDGEPRVLATLPLRYDEILWGSDGLALVYEWWWPTRRIHAWRVRPGSPEAEKELVFDFSWEDRYSDPGLPVTERDPRGRRVLAAGGDGREIFLIGDGASPEGDRPFLDVHDLASGAARRLFRSEAPWYERPVALLAADGGAVLTRRETVDEPPSYFVRSLTGEAGEGGALRPLTDFPHPTPQLRGLEKELVRYTRADGIELSGTLYTPPGYSSGDGPLPLLVWAYPQEFKSADAAGQVQDSPYRFARVGWWSPLLFLARGYAVLDDPGMPIVGEGDAEPNDTYVEQLVASAQAAVDEMVRRGVAERGRIAIGGHSYGAFMAANLLAHSDLFAAGIARSGAYNRTLTPFGFQAEERSVWKAPEVYVAMSPFMHADKVDEPLLLIHGEADNNSGTFPMQSERFFDALKGLGATTRLVMLPLESHGYRGEQSILHMLWEIDRWLERYVKDGLATEAAGTEPAATATVP